MRTAAVMTALAVVLAGCARTAQDDAAGSSPAPTPGSTVASAGAPGTQAPTASCSAGGLRGDLPEQEGLPEPVARMREQVHEATLECDYQRLEELALEGSGEFTASFGGAASPAAFWEQEEAAGREPLRLLAEVLRLDHAITDSGAGQHYVWPAAFARDTWQEVPQDERAELRRLYSERDLQSFEQFGAYLGHRVLISPGGDWRVFVAGD